MVFRAPQVGLLKHSGGAWSCGLAHAPRYSYLMTPITTTAAVAAFCEQVQGQPFVAVDTEFMRETTYWPKLCLIQAATPTVEAVIDPLAPDIDLSPFLALMADPGIEK